MKKSKAEIAREWNDKAANLGCKARIGGRGKAPKFYEWRGGYTEGFEVWHPINSQRFALLTSKYPELH